MYFDVGFMSDSTSIYVDYVHVYVDYVHVYAMCAIGIKGIKQTVMQLTNMAQQFDFHPSHFRFIITTNSNRYYYMDKTTN